MHNLRMTPLVDRILEHIPHDIFTDTELVALQDGSVASRHNQVKRAIAKGELVHVRRGVYLLAKRYQRNSIQPYELAHKIYGPSYISFESALSFHGLIPEAVYTVSSASLKRSQTFQTPVGTYAFTQIPKRIFFHGVVRVQVDKEVFLMATPVKALADYIFHKKPQQKTASALLESLRIQKEDLKIDPAEIDALIAGYKSKKVASMLEDLKRELRL